MDAGQFGKFFGKRPWLLVAVSCILSLLVVEATLQVISRVKTGRWRFSIDLSIYPKLFMAHPYLVVAPRPGAQVRNAVELYEIGAQARHFTISHNSLGWRGREISLRKQADVKRVVVLGGSTTYCSGVSNNETWPFFLEQRLGSGWEILNLGVPGYTTVEHLIQTALQLSDLQPDIAIYYVGWNDMRNYHIKDLKPDYSDFHGKVQYYNLGLDSFRFGEQFLFLCLLRRFISRVLFYDDYADFAEVKGDDQAFTTSVDRRALSLYARNLRSIIALCKHFGITPIFIPQVMNRLALASDKYNIWIPFLKDEDIPAVLKLYNEQLREVASQEKAGFIGEVSLEKFHGADFIDQGHFSPAGNKKFAEMVFRYLRSPGLGD